MISIERATYTIGRLLDESFVHSESAYMDIESSREMTYHTYCDPDMVSRASEILSSKLKGRILSQEDSPVLEQIIQLAKENGREFVIHDVSVQRDGSWR